MVVAPMQARMTPVISWRVGAPSAAIGCSPAASSLRVALNSCCYAHLFPTNLVDLPALVARLEHLLSTATKTTSPACGMSLHGLSTRTSSD